MANNFFQFKQFIVYQNLCAMKVGTDGVLLGSWVNCKNAGSVLDIGTGTGLIALMVAQRSEALIDAIDIDANAASQAKANSKNSPWQNRITVYNISLQDFQLENRVFDLIVTNPPYFSNSLRSPDSTRNLARHNNALAFEDIIEATGNLLSFSGRLAIILPVPDFHEFNKIANSCKLHLIRKTSVKPSPHKPIKRILAEFCRNNSQIIEDELILEEGQRHHYSKEYIELTKDFYLNF